MKRRILHPAVMTSSSIREYSDLFYEVMAVSDVNRFDLMILRDVDVESARISPTAGLRMADVLAQNYSAVEAWMVRELRPHTITISALATYFPDITTVDNVRRRTAIEAVANTVRMAASIRSELGNKVMPCPIVEIVCGTILDQDPNTGRIQVFGRERKLDLLWESLGEIVKLAKQHVPTLPFALALELEPGETYVLNSLSALTSIARRINSPNSSMLRKHVGLNLDIAHMRIAGIKAAELRSFMSLFVHSHISDHPGMHTHDQVVGSWTNVHAVTGGYQPYIAILLDRAKSAKRGDLPFSRSIAIELEGCNRAFAIHDSVSRLRQVIQMAEEREAAKGRPPRSIV